ncbi:hypothetical protein FB451DRAFT_1444954 [Mycena latifolia]|nr:hypothetical protein FB451DRAFT_1444954 [Mycena latifolia]
MGERLGSAATAYRQARPSRFSPAFNYRYPPTCTPPSFACLSPNAVFKNTASLGASASWTRGILKPYCAIRRRCLPATETAPRVTVGAAPHTRVTVGAAPRHAHGARLLYPGTPQAHHAHTPSVPRARPIWARRVPPTRFRPCAPRPRSRSRARSRARARLRTARSRRCARSAQTRPPAPCDALVLSGGLFVCFLGPYASLLFLLFSISFSSLLFSSSLPSPPRSAHTPRSALRTRAPPPLVFYGSASASASTRPRPPSTQHRKGYHTLICNYRARFGGALDITAPRNNGNNESNEFPSASQDSDSDSEPAKTPGPNHFLCGDSPSPCNSCRKKNGLWKATADKKYVSKL